MTEVIGSAIEGVVVIAPSSSLERADMRFVDRQYLMFDSLLGRIERFRRTAVTSYVVGTEHCLVSSGESGGSKARLQHSCGSG